TTRRREVTPGRDEPERVGERQDARDHESAEFAERVAGDERRTERLGQREHATRLTTIGGATTKAMRNGLHHRLEQRDARGEDRGLCDGRVVETVGGS